MSYNVLMIDNLTSTILWNYTLNVSNPNMPQTNLTAPQIALNQQVTIIVIATSDFNETLTTIMSVIGSVSDDTYLGVRTFILCSIQSLFTLCRH